MCLSIKRGKQWHEGISPAACKEKTKSPYMTNLLTACGLSGKCKDERRNGNSTSRGCCTSPACTPNKLSMFGEPSQLVRRTGSARLVRTRTYESRYTYVRMLLHVRTYLALRTHVSCCKIQRIFVQDSTHLVARFSAFCPTGMNPYTLSYAETFCADWR